MAYAATTDVQDYLPTGYTIGGAAPGSPSTAQVGRFLADTAGEIDSALASRGFTVPVTQPPAFVAELVTLNAKGAAAKTLGVIFPFVTTANAAGGGAGPQSLVTQLSTEYNARLNQLRQGIGIPGAAPENTADFAPRSYWTDNPYAAPSTVDPNPAPQLDRYGGLADPGPAFSKAMVF